MPAHLHKLQSKKLKSNLKVNLIRKYFLEGRKPTAISKYLNVSKSTVYRIISQLKIQKRINKQEKRGRPKKLQKKHKKFLRNLISYDVLFLYKNCKIDLKNIMIFKFRKNLSLNL